MSWLFLIVGILTLIALQWLRGVMSIILSVPTVRIGGCPDAARFGGFGLLDKTAAELAELGFGEPLWLHNEDDGDGGSLVDIQAVFPHTRQGVLAWVSPGINSATPRQLLVSFTTELADGRQAVTQVGDPFYAALGDAQTPAQTVEAHNRAGEYRRHLEFVEGLGAEPRQRPATRRDALKFADQHVRGIRQRFLDAGKLKLSGGHARPGFRLGFRILWHIIRAPKTKDSGTEAIPNARLRRFQRIARIAANRAPARHVQWSLLGLSAVLFLGFGWPVFGLQITAILLAVVLFHEAGHWAAMRAFGYRNPHITLLPLLGGVAIGHESDPNAAKRAWVSLAGPLPGIVLGWGMLLLGGDLSMSDTAHDWWQQTALFLLIVNYLNILPIPPLDGSHVLTALLPPRWVVVQILVLFAGIAIGVYLSWTIDFWLLAIIAGLQLLFVKSMWRNAQLVRQIAAEPADVEDRRLWVLEQIELQEGPATNAAKRLGQAEHVIRHIDLTPMSVFQRLLVSSVFVALLVVPVGFLAVGAAVLSGSDEEVWDGDSTMLDLYQAMDADRKRLERETEGLELAELLQLAAATGLPPPATDESILATEERLGTALPDDLRSLYSIADGVPEIALGPVDSVRPVTETELLHGALMHWQYDGKMYFEGADSEYHTVDVSKARHWWVLSDGDGLDELFFYDPRARGQSPSYFLFDLGIAWAHEDLRSLMRQRVVEEQVNENFQRRLELELERAAERLAHLSITELVDELYQPSWLERLMAGEAWRTQSTSEGELLTLEQALGRRLPADHRLLLTSDIRRMNLGVLAPDSVVQFGKVDDDHREHIVTMMSERLDEADAEIIDQCWVVLGFVIEAWEGNKTETVIPRALWCPQLSPEHWYYASDQTSFYPSLTKLVRAEVARMSLSY